MYETHHRRRSVNIFKRNELNSENKPSNKTPSLHEDKNLIHLTEQKQWQKILGNIKNFIPAKSFTYFLCNRPCQIKVT